MKCNEKWLQTKAAVEYAMQQLANQLFEINTELNGLTCQCCRPADEMEDEIEPSPGSPPQVSAVVVLGINLFTDQLLFWF